MVVAPKVEVDSVGGGGWWKEGPLTFTFMVPVNKFTSYFFSSRDSYGNFLARLETTFGVSQKGVQIIAGEMCELSNRVLAHCMKSVSEHLGKLKVNYAC
jgi:hypothetical protein